MRKMFLLVLLGCGLLSCNRHETDGVFPSDGAGFSDLPMVTASTYAAVRVSNDWLRFGSMDDFVSVMGILHDDYEVGKLDEWERQFPDYVSLRKAYETMEAGVTDGATPAADSLIRAGLLLDCPDSRFAAVLSRSGRIQIADTLYQFLPGQPDGKAYAIPDRHIDALLSGADAASLEGTVIHLTSFVWTPFPKWEDGRAETGSPGNIGIRICSFPNTPMFNWWGQMGADIYGDDNGFSFPKDNGRTVKLNYHRWRVSYIFYSSVGVRVKMWKHTRFAGWLSNIDFREANMEACTKGFVLNHLGIPIPFTVSFSPAYTAYATNSFEQTLKWHADPVFSEIFLLHFNFRFKVDYKGHVAQRFIRQ